MTNQPGSDTDLLLRRAREGDQSAVQALLGRYRDRLRQMVAVRMDPRLAPRFDPSDVVQEALVDASRKLPAYLRDRPILFYPWIRQIAWERLVHLQARHLRAQKRSVNREVPWDPRLSDESVLRLAERFASSGTSPSAQAIRAEVRLRVRAALEELPDRDRELLTLRYLEQLATAEIAAVLGISQGAVKTRHFRAVQRLQKLLQDETGIGPP